MRTSKNDKFKKTRVSKDANDIQWDSIKEKDKNNKVSSSRIMSLDFERLKYINNKNNSNPVSPTSPENQYSDDSTSPSYLSLSSNSELKSPSRRQSVVLGKSRIIPGSPGSPLTPRTPRLKRATTHQGISEVIIKHQIDQWKTIKSGGSPRDKIIEKFEIGRLIGSGGSGSKVYECRLHDGGTFAVKKFSKKSLFETDIEKIKQERDIMEQLPYHYSLIYYKGHYETIDHIYIFMGLHNDDLMSYLKNLKNLSKYIDLKEVIKMSIDILTGLSILHECQIIHRDLKSANIFVNYGPDNKVKYLTVGDFDTAKKVENLDGTKTCIGTTLWAAPEVLNISESEKAYYSFSADMWSFGMVLYELMTCQIPYYEEKNSFRPLFNVLAGIKPILTKETLDRYNLLIRYWNQCLELDPEQRPVSDKLLIEFEKLYTIVS